MKTPFNSISWFIIDLLLVVVFFLGTQVIETLPTETQQTILNLNIVLAVG